MVLLASQRRDLRFLGGDAPLDALDQRPEPNGVGVPIKSYERSRVPKDESALSELGHGARPIAAKREEVDSKNPDPHGAFRRTTSSFVAGPHLVLEAIPKASLRSHKPPSTNVFWVGARSRRALCQAGNTHRIPWSSGMLAASQR